MSLTCTRLCFCKHDAIFSREDKATIEGAVLGPEAFVLRWFDDADDDRLAIFNLARKLNRIRWPNHLEPPSPDRKWNLSRSSEDARYGGNGHAAIQFDRLARAGARSDRFPCCKPIKPQEFEQEEA